MLWCGNDVIFKTYVRGDDREDGKSPGEKVKGRDFISTWQQVQNQTCFGAIMNKGFVDISFDTKEMYEAFLDMAEANDWRCLCLPSSKGGHTYWRNEQGRIVRGGKDKKLACGLVADIHSGSTYIPLRVHGADRFPPDFDIFDGEDYQEFPDELKPVTTNIDLWGMGAGDGRNDDLYKYILILQGAGMTKDTIRRVLTNANKFCFKQPLDEDELQVIMRDEAFQKPTFFKDKVFQFSEFAQYLVNAAHIVKVQGQLYVYRDGVYVTGQEKIEQEMIHLIPILKKAQRSEVMAYIWLIAPEKKPADARYILFRNGVYDIVTGNMIDPSPDLILTNRIDWDYNPAAYDELADTTLNNIACDDPEIRALLEECIGYCMYRRSERGKAFMLTGGGANGKSTFLAVVRGLLCEDNICSLDIHELGDRFSTAMMTGKLACIGDDLGDDFLQGQQVAIFKKVVTGDRLKAEYKGMNPYEFNPYCKLLFSANDIPRMKDKTGAVKRRLVIIPFNAVFKKGAPGYKTFIKYDLMQPQAMEYFIKVGIEGLKRIEENDGFTESTKVKEQVDQYEAENNPIIDWLAETDVEKEVLHQPTAEVYRLYSIYCGLNNMQAMSKVVFSKQVCKRLNMQVVDKRMKGKKCRVFEWL